MYKLNISITEEAAGILKELAKKYGSTMGTMVTMLLLDKQKEMTALYAFEYAKAEEEKSKKENG